MASSHSQASATEAEGFTSPDQHMDTPSTPADKTLPITATGVADDISHQVISSHFIGPRAENLDFFHENISVILDEVRKARLDYFPADGTFITDDIQNTPAFQKSKEKLARAVKKTANLLGRTSIPFWSPRYQAHMCTDMSMASLLGYFMTMIYNPNNVAIEASPLTTVAEIEVGEQLCELFGYNVDEDDLSTPTGWGHVTCGGTVANLESIWVARNLKFWPLSLKKAVAEGGALHFLAESFVVETCQGERKLFSRLSTWELLNLKPTDILDLPERLCREHGISNQFLSDTMRKFTIQSTGKDRLEVEFGMEQPAQYLLSTTAHYSWPKGAAICGLGSDHVIGIAVDEAARIDIKALEEHLATSLKKQQAVYAVVAVIGTTEEGAVDSLKSILALRKQFQARGLSFLVHADAAWGGYFCSMLPRDYQPGDVTNLPTEMGQDHGFVPDASLRAETQEDLYAMRFADSITVDPHKAGYIPYPAGGLCYRDGRMRYMVTWTSPYLSRGSVTSIGIYGVEGSKPGAAAMAAWLSNKTIGLSPDGYGSLLSEVTWTCTRLSAEWAALTDDASPFICVPLNKLPAEQGPHPTAQEIEAQKAFIKREIVDKTNRQIVRDSQGRPAADSALHLMRQLGSDLNINAFALNFRHRDGRLNDDIEEANYLMQRVVEALSVDSPADAPAALPLFLTSTAFSDALYGACKARFAARLGLAPSAQDLVVLRNVVMSPFPTDGRLTNALARVLYRTAAAEAEVVRARNELTEDVYRFLLQGAETLYAVHLPMFHVANHRQQIVLAVALDEASAGKYAEMMNASPHEPMILVTQHKIKLQDLLAQTTGSFDAYIMTKASGQILQDVRVTITNTVVSRPLNSRWRLQDYPDHFMPFYLYGTATEANIDHVLTRAPNTQLSASGCTLELDDRRADALDPQDDAAAAKAAPRWHQQPQRQAQTQDARAQAAHILVLDDVSEAPMQPFPPNAEIEGNKHGGMVPPLVVVVVGGGGGGGSTPDHDHVHHHNNNTTTTTTKTPPPRPSPRLTGRSTASAAAAAAFFFRPGAAFRVSVWEDGQRGRATSRGARPGAGRLVGRGTLRLGARVFVDSEAVNADPCRKADPVAAWRREFAAIGSEY